MEQARDPESGMPLIGVPSPTQVPTHFRAGDELASDPLAGSMAPSVPMSTVEQNGQPEPMPLSAVQLNFVAIVNDEAWMLDSCYRAADAIINPPAAGIRGMAVPQGFSPYGPDQGPKVEPVVAMFSVELYKQTRERLKVKYEGHIPPMAEPASIEKK